MPRAQGCILQFAIHGRFASLSLGFVIALQFVAILLVHAQTPGVFRLASVAPVRARESSTGMRELRSVCGRPFLLQSASFIRQQMRHRLVPGRTPRSLLCGVVRRRLSTVPEGARPPSARFPGKMVKAGFVALHQPAARRRRRPVVVVEVSIVVIVEVSIVGIVVRIASELATGELTAAVLAAARNPLLELCDFGFQPLDLCVRFVTFAFSVLRFHPYARLLHVAANRHKVVARSDQFVAQSFPSLR